MCATLMQRLRILRPDLRIFSIQAVPCQQRDLNADGASTRTAIVRSGTIGSKGVRQEKNVRACGFFQQVVQKEFAPVEHAYPLPILSAFKCFLL